MTKTTFPLFRGDALIWAKGADEGHPQAGRSPLDKFPELPATDPLPSRNASREPLRAPVPRPAAPLRHYAVGHGPPASINVRRRCSPTLPISGVAQQPFLLVQPAASRSIADAEQRRLVLASKVVDLQAAQPRPWNTMARRKRCHAARLRRRSKQCAPFAGSACSSAGGVAAPSVGPVSPSVRNGMK